MKRKTDDADVGRWRGERKSLEVEKEREGVCV